MNNKGFAIISLVYGLVLVAAVLLFLTLKIMDNTNSQNDAIADEIEGQLIYPHVVGKSIGLPGIFVLFSACVAL